jgi:hypothetical protein
MYVDDCLVSSESDDKAVELIDNLRSLCKDGGFNLTKWISSSSVVMNSILEKDRAKEVKLWNLDNECCVERALGVYWFVDSNTLGFQINIKSKPMTKRGILSIASCSISLGQFHQFLHPIRFLVCINSAKLTFMSIRMETQFPTGHIQS